MVVVANTSNVLTRKSVIYNKNSKNTEEKDDDDDDDDDDSCITCRRRRRRCLPRCLLAFVGSIIALLTLDAYYLLVRPSAKQLLNFYLQW